MGVMTLLTRDPAKSYSCSLKQLERPLGGRGRDSGGSAWGVRDWTEPFGSSTWTKDTVTPP
jgi:hypothetical protein